MQLPCSALFILFPFLLWANHVSSQRSTYIVHMDKSYMPKPFSNHHSWYSSLLKSAKSAASTSSDADASETKIIYTYDNALHGFSAVMSGDELDALKSSAGFISAYADHAVTADTTQSSKFLGLNTAAGIWPASNYGKDVIIGVIDTGIWPESPSFSDTGMTDIPARWKGVCDGGEEFNSSLCNKKIIGARYFNKGFRALDPRGIRDTARDDDGHGSHVSSIAAGNFVEGVSFFGYANGTARGMAPRARLAVYKVLWFGAVASDVVAGIDQAVADGVDILSISVSSIRNELYENPMSIAGFGAREKGVVVCLSAGNAGTGGLRTLVSGIPWAVVVAAGTIDRWFTGTLTLGNGKTIAGWTLFPARATLKNLQLVFNESLSSCELPEYLQLAPYDTIFICNISESSSYETVMLYQLQYSSIRASIIISEDPRVFRITSSFQPAIVINRKEGRDLINYATTSPSPTATIEFQRTIIGRGPRAAPALSDESSKGPALTYEGILKPDIMAPGVLILAAFNPYNLASEITRSIQLSSDYNILTSSSMACAHISGIAALLKAAHPDWSASAIQSAMMTTANHLDNSNQPIKLLDNTVATPLGMGSGQVDPNRALDPGLVYDASPQDMVNLVCSMNFTRNQTQTIIRSSYSCSNPSSDLNYPSFVALFRAADIGRTITRRFRRVVTNVGSGAATYKVMLEVPANTTARVEPQTLVFGKKNEKKRYILTIRYKADVVNQHRAGTLIWVEETGKYRVRSPIMVSAFSDILSP